MCKAIEKCRGPTANGKSHLMTTERGEVYKDWRCFVESTYWTLFPVLT